MAGRKTQTGNIYPTTHAACKANLNLESEYDFAQTGLILPSVYGSLLAVAETGGDQQGPWPPLTPLIYSLIFMNSANFANFALTGPPQLANLGNPASAIDCWAYLTTSRTFYLRGTIGVALMLWSMRDETLRFGGMQNGMFIDIFSILFRTEVSEKNQVFHLSYAFMRSKLH
jgi:hypothetical protein